MTKEEILENNKLIAKFVGLVPHNMFPEEYSAPYGFEWMAVRVNIKADYLEEDGEFVSHEVLFEFHSSWDWLMPCIEKIESIPFDTLNSIYTSYTKCPFGIYLNFKCAKATVDNDFKLETIHKEVYVFTEFNEDSKIIAAYKAVIEFIKWYNINKKL